MNNEYRLQLLNHSEIFPTREEAVEYIEDNFKGTALWSEPAIFFYGTEREPKMILAVGASKSTTRPRICYIDDAELRELIAAVQAQTDENADNIQIAADRILNIVSAVGLTLDENKIKDQISYDPSTTDELIGRAKTVAEAIAIISTFVQAKLKENELTVNDGKSIDFDFNKTENGSTLTAEVKISEEGNDDDLEFNNNIVGLKADGVFASCNIEFDAERNRLIFTTSGMKNGRFVTDANKKIIDFGTHTIYTADNEDHTVQLTINQETKKISADVKISNDDDNLLVQKDGKMYVSGRAKDIKYKNTTVGAKLNAIDEEIANIFNKIQILTVEDLIEGDESDTILTKAIKKQNGGYTVTADVRLSTDNSIGVANGGLKANVDIDVDSTNNKLVLRVGNNEKAISLPGISILDNIYYDSANKCIVITWKDGQQQTVIPVGDMLKTWIVENPTSSPIVLTKSESSVAGQPEVLSADIKIAQTDNLIGKDSYGQIYVRKSDIDNKINEEATARQTADNTLQSSINAEATARHTADDELNNAINAAREEAAANLETAKTDIYSRIDVDEDKINEAFANAEEAKNLVTLTNANLDAEINRAQTAESANAAAINGLTSRTTALESGLANETSARIAKDGVQDEKISSLETATASLTTRTADLESGLSLEKSERTTADAVHDERIANLSNGLESAEESHREDIENLSSLIHANTDAIAVLNGSESTVGSVLEAVKGAKTYAETLSANEKERAMEKETLISLSLEEEIGRARDAEAQVLADGKSYTDHSIADAKVLSDIYTDNAKADAIAQSKSYTDTQIAGIDSTSKAYTDSKVEIEKNRAMAAEGANATAIVSLQEKDTQIDTELAKKVENVEIVKSSQSDLQYILKVDGVDVSEINIPADKFLKSASYDSGNKELVFVFTTEAGDETVRVSIVDLVNTYTAGNGLVLNANNEFSVKINEDTESYLSLTAEGIKITGINAALATKANAADVYTKQQVDDKIGDIVIPDVSGFATKTEVSEGLATVQADVTENSNRITVAEAQLANKIESVQIVKNSQSDLQYTLKVDGVDAGEINIPKDQFLEDVSYNERSKEIEFVFQLTTGTKIVKVAVDDLVDTYTAGNGLALTDNKFSVVIDPSSDEYITLSENGIKVSGITAAINTKANAADVYTKAESDAKYLTEHQDISGLATKAELNDAVTTLNEKDTQIDTELAKKIEEVSVEKNSANDLQYIIKVDGQSVGTIDIPKDQFLKTVTYDSGNKAIVFTFETSEGTEVVSVSVADLVDTYTAGNGLALTDNKFSVRINEDSESYLTVTPEGIKISGIDAALAEKANIGTSYTKSESDAKYLTEHQDISGLATKAELQIVDTKATNNADAIAVINGNESQEGSIKKALADANAYTDTEILTEKTRAMAAENANSDAIAVINGNEAQEGSIKKALADANAYTDDKVAELGSTVSTQFATVNDTLSNKANKSEVYTKTEIDAKGYLVGSDIEHLASKAELQVVDTKATNNSDAIAVINGNEAQEGSIKKALADANAYTDVKVATKANAADVYTKTEIDNKNFLTSSDIANLATTQALNDEIDRATGVETNLQSEIDTANTNITENTNNIAALGAEARRLNLIVDETNTVKLTKSKDDNGTELAADVKLDTTATNIIKVSGNGIYADVEMTYSQATNTITFNNGLATQEFQLAGASLLEDGYYNSSTKQIVLVTRLADGTTRNIIIDADALIHTLKVDNGTQNPIKLAKTTDSDGVDVLSARLDISTENHNLILNNNGTLYASNEAKNHTALWNGAEKTLQEVLELLKIAAEEGSGAAQDISELRAELREVERDVNSIETDISNLTRRVEANTTAIATNTGSINTLTTQVSDLNGRVTNLTNDFNVLTQNFNELEDTVDSYDGRITNLESDVAILKTNVNNINNDLDTLHLQLGDISGPQTVSERIEILENNPFDPDFGTY